MSPRAPSLPPQERRRQLETAALRVLRVRGTAATTKEIAQAAGVAEGTLFRAFGCKDDLVAAALRRGFDPRPLLATLDGIDLDQPLRDRLVGAVTAIQERLVDVFDLMAAVGMIEPPDHHHHEHHGSDGSWQRQVLDRLIEIVEPDAETLRVSPSELVRLLRLLTFSGSHRQIGDGELLGPELIVDALLDGTRRVHRCC
jgi:AcrR family transcriptional regulator